MIKDLFEKGAISFAIGSFAGLMVNFIIDLVAHAMGAEQFCSISPDFQALFPTTAMAAYANVLLYGCISAAFAVMTFIYDIERIGFLIQSIIYFLVTGSVCILITTLLWQLHRYPAALICTLAGYAVTHIIMFTVCYRKLKNDIQEINTQLE